MRVRSRLLVVLCSWLLIAVFATALLTSSALATPDYARQTGQPCGTCHARPEGGGELTLLGMAYARGGYQWPVPEGLEVYTPSNLARILTPLMTKSILTTVVLLLAIAQAVVGLRLRGYLKFLPLPIRRLRGWHRWSGDVTLVLIAIVAGMCVTGLGFGLYTPRERLHAALGALAALVMVLKVIIARRFRSRLRYQLILGAIAGFSLLGTFIASALWYFWSLL
jgi:multisubunit Na+/H+ antiporter MnhC subunit